MVNTPEQEWQPFAHMPKDDLHARVCVEDAAEHQPDTVGGGLHGKTPRGREQRREVLYIVFVISLNDGAMGYGRVYVQWHVQGLGPLKNRPELLVIEEHTVGQPVYHGAFEPQRGDCPLQLISCSLGVGCRQRRKPGESIRVCGDRLGKTIVSVTRQPHGGLRVQTLGRRRAVRDHLDINPCLVHLLEAQLAEVIQPATDFRRPTFWTVKGRRHFGIVIVLFQCDDKRLPHRFHVRSSLERNVTLLRTLRCCLCIMCTSAWQCRSAYERLCIRRVHDWLKLGYDRLCVSAYAPQEQTVIVYDNPSVNKFITAPRTLLGE